MNDNALMVPNLARAIEEAVMNGNLAGLTSEQRVMYYKTVCESVGLNPFTRPFDYITLNGKLTLYAKKDATDQLRNLRKVNITKIERERLDGIYVVTAYAATADGRTDASVGAVSVEGLRGDALANAIMKAETKAKRRVTLSICGLGMLDETELETLPDARPAPQVTVIEQLRPELPAQATLPTNEHATTKPPLHPSANNDTRPKLAVIRTPAFAAQVVDFANNNPYYQTKTGLPDSGHILGAAVKRGYPEITNDNLAALWSSLREYAAEQQTLEGAPEPA